MIWIVNNKNYFYCSTFDFWQSNLAFGGLLCSITCFETNLLSVLKGLKVVGGESISNRLKASWNSMMNIKIIFSCDIKQLLIFRYDCNRGRINPLIAEDLMKGVNSDEMTPILRKGFKVSANNFGSPESDLILNGFSTQIFLLKITR